MVEEPSERLSYYFDIFKYHSNWKTLALWSQLRTFMYEYPDEYKGFVPFSTVGPAPKTDNAAITDREPIPAEQEEYLTDLLTYLKEKNLNALFVITPYDVQEDEQKKINYISDIVTAAGYNFLDMDQYVDEIGLDYDVDFKDYGTHTNIVGAYKVTKFFEDYLKKNYVNEGILADHRGDSKYKSWDNAYKLWLEAYETGSAEVIYNAENKIYYDLEEGE
jgi:hypothetical protein